MAHQHVKRFLDFSSTRHPRIRTADAADFAARASRKRARLAGQSGSTAIEFALVMICLIPLFFGTIAMGFTIGQAIEAIQVTRDTGHMYAEAVDFDSANAQQLVTQLASGFDLSSSGNAVLIFSKIITVFTADCTSASVSPCTNAGSAVFTQRQTIGNTSLKTSPFGTPPSTYMDSDGIIQAKNYLQQSTLVATGFTSLITQSDGDIAYLVEGYFSEPDLSFLKPGYTGSSGTGGIYARAIF